MRDPELWQRIRDKCLPSPPAFTVVTADATAGPLETRLGEAERWAPDYARRAIEEYGRFLYLARVSDRQVTPSAIIDTVWHEHIIDSRDYVDGFCMPLFGEILHHEPASDPDEMPRFEAQYAATRALYEKEFGTEPPDDVWIYRSPEQVAQDRHQARLSFWGSKLIGLGLGVALFLLFGWVAGALFLAFVAATVAELVLAPRIPGPRFKSSGSDSSGCGGCGGD